jgi:hypothetical protein
MKPWKGLVHLGCVKYIIFVPSIKRELGIFTWYSQ